MFSFWAGVASNFRFLEQLPRHSASALPSIGNKEQGYKYNSYEDRFSGEKMDAANRNPDMATSLASSVIAVSDILTLSVAEISERMKRSSEKNSSERHIFEIAEEGARLTAAQQDVVDSKLR